MNLTPAQLDKAAEAARRAYLASIGSRATMTWEELMDETRDRWRAVAKAAIEAVEQAAVSPPGICEPFGYPFDD